MNVHCELALAHVLVGSLWENSTVVNSQHLWTQVVVCGAMPAVRLLIDVFQL